MKQLRLLACLFCVLPMAGQASGSQDFLEAAIAIEVDAETRSIAGNAHYTFEVRIKTDSVFLDAVGMDFSKLRLNGKKVRFRNQGKRLVIYYRFKTGVRYTLDLVYSSEPKQSVYFIGWEDHQVSNNQIWTQGQGKYSSHWVPSFDDMNEKLVYDLSITFDKSYEVIANGRLRDTTLTGNRKTWRYDMKDPMSSYLLAFAIGTYRKDTLRSGSGIPITLYYYPSDSLKAGPTYRYSREIFDFLEAEIGVPYPWQNYKQVPVRDFLYAGMENTGTTLFSDAYVIDSIGFADRNYVNINAHELAHQWFGNLVTESSGSHHWLHEGFATYYAYLAEKQLFGEDYFYWKLYDTALVLDRMSREGGGEALTDPAAGSLTFYEKGAWALFMLREQVGEIAFKQGIKDYLTTYRFENATIRGFLDLMEAASGMDLASFEEEWLRAEAFPFRKAVAGIAASCESLGAFLSLQEELTTSPEANRDILARHWEGNPAPRFLEAVIKAHYGSLDEDLRKKAFATGDLRVRQALALETVDIPPSLKEQYESLLSDRSYVTMESALYKLWVYFDGDRARYLDQTSEVIGLPNRNVRLLWLTLALLTPGYEPGNTMDYLSELGGYTAPAYGFETRLLAFEYLNEAFAFSDQNLKDLLNATAHHSWQFRNYARKLVDSLLDNKEYRERLKALTRELREEEIRYLRQKLERE